MKKRTHDALDFVARLLSSRIVLRTPERHVVIRPGTTTLPKELQRVVIVKDYAGLPTTMTKKTCDSVMVSVCQCVPANYLHGHARRRVIRDGNHKLRQQRIQVVRQAIIDCGLTPSYVNANTHKEWKFQVILPEGWHDQLLEMRKLDTSTS